MKNILKELNIEVHLAHKIIGATEENHHIPWRRLYDYEMLFVTEGEITVKTKKNTYTVAKNQVHIMPPFLYHTRFVPRGKTCNYYGLHLDFFRVKNNEFSIHEAYIVPIENNDDIVSSEKISWVKRTHFSGIHVAPIINIENPDLLKKLFSKAIRIFKNQSGDPFASIILNASASEIVHAILLECTQTNITLFTRSENLHEDIISNFIEHIETEYMHNIDVDALIKSYGLSKNHFAKIFKKATNTTPHDYIVDYRIEKAKVFLQEGSHYVNEIARMVGYPDYAYFSRLFKKKEGVSPKNYLRLQSKR